MMLMKSNVTFKVGKLAKQFASFLHRRDRLTCWLPNQILTHVLSLSLHIDSTQVAVIQRLPAAWFKECEVCFTARLKMERC